MEKLAAGDPQRIGAYRLLARLGAGGMGQVYLARSDRGRTVAVKLVRGELAEQDEFRDRFRHEVSAARRVGGEWTAPVLDADTEAPVPWVATGYVAGPALQEVVSGAPGGGAGGPVGPGRSGKPVVHGPLPARSVRILASGLAHALQDIHAAGLIHRDLKPSNVLVTIEGPRVIDFGIARALETVTDDGLTRTGALVGSPGFMAPEQVRGTPVTAACDVFSLGSVLAYAATGRLPFGAADTAVHVLMFRIAQEEPDLSELPEGLAELVADCLQKDPAARPAPEQILERVGEPDDDEPWLPGGLLAQLGSHAVQLLDHEEPGSRTELAFSKPPKEPGPAGAEGPAGSEGTPNAPNTPSPQSPQPPQPGTPRSVHGMPTMITSPAPAPGPQAPPTPMPQAALPPPPQGYGYPRQPGPAPLPPWGATPPFGHAPPYGHPYGPTPPYALPQPHPRRESRGTAVLLAVALVVAIGAGGSVYAFMDSGSKDNGAQTQVSDPPSGEVTPPPEEPADTSEDPPSESSPSMAEDEGDGEVPEKYLGTWTGGLDSAAGRSSRRLVIEQGEVGDTVLTVTAEGPLKGGGTYRCLFEAALSSVPGSGSPLKIGPSSIITGEPMSSCTPGSPTELTILNDGRLRRVTTTDGKSVTFTKGG